ncbi:hypothetical protein [Solemya pervernicosa gill symbiont]|nr:hypothetical protein [Solemya pervernicosa gill symbiont]
MSDKSSNNVIKDNQNKILSCYGFNQLIMEVFDGERKINFAYFFDDKQVVMVFNVDQSDWMKMLEWFFYAKNDPKGECVKHYDPVKLKVDSLEDSGTIKR